MIHVEGLVNSKEKEWSPYEFNGGTIVGIAAKDFVLLAADTRLVSGYQILNRKVERVHKINQNVIMGTCGFQGDAVTLVKEMKMIVDRYQESSGRLITCDSFCNRLSLKLYSKRFFPYYSFPVVAGFDNEGSGCVYSFDPVGCIEKLIYSASGNGSEVMIPLLSNLFANNNLSNHEKITRSEQVDMTVEQLCLFAVNLFRAASNRLIEIGDGVMVTVLSKDGTVNNQFFPLLTD